VCAAFQRIYRCSSPDKPRGTFPRLCDDDGYRAKAAPDASLNKMQWHTVADAKGSIPRSSNIEREYRANAQVISLGATLLSGPV
jgi:hypothetical protein